MNVAGAPARLASLKPGGDAQSREKPGCGARGDIDSDAQAATDTESSSVERLCAERSNRYWLWLDHAIVGLWIVLLLSIVALAVVGGESVMAELDGLDLVATYSLHP